MKNYLEALENCYKNGVDVLEDRTGIGRRKIFGQQLRWNLTKGLPVMTTKKVNVDAVIHELIWLLSGSTNIEYLVKNGVKIWTEWCYDPYLKTQGLSDQYPRYSSEWTERMREFEQQIANDHEFALKWGELGPTYSKQWRNFGATRNSDGSFNNDGVDQIRQAQDLLRKNPNSTRIIVNAWHAREAVEVTLPPCHTMFQFNSFLSTEGKRCLVLEMYMRSADAFLGVPFNITSYAILAHMMAQTTGHEAFELVIHFNDFHIYLNHFEAVETQLARTPKELPTLWLNPEIDDILNFKFEDLKVQNYNPDPFIKAQVAVQEETMISQIVAYDKNFVIGANNKLLWRIPEDMEYFKDKTTGNSCVMGKETYISIPAKFRPLPNRLNVVLTTTGGITEIPDSLIVAKSIPDAFDAIKYNAHWGKKDIFFTGGQKVYTESIKYTEQVFATEVDIEIDITGMNEVRYYPKLDPDIWEETWREDHLDSKIPFSFVIYKRRRT